MRSPIHVSLDTEILKRFTELSQSTGKSRNEIISNLVEEWIEDYEDYLLVKEAHEELKAGKDSTISHEEFKKEMARLNNDHQE